MLKRNAFSLWVGLPRILSPETCKPFNRYGGVCRDQMVDRSSRAISFLLPPSSFAGRLCAGPADEESAL